MFRFNLYILLFISSLHSAAKLKPGVYRAELVLNETEDVRLPFNFELSYKKNKPVIVIRNAEERITVDEIKTKKDSLFIRMPVFDTEFRCLVTGDSLRGVWINHYRKENNIIPFLACFGHSHRFPFTPGKANPVFEGKWEVIFSPGKLDSSKAIGIFHHMEQTDYVTGTFLTETGDYRYLEGMRSRNKLYLSCFDGSHAFLFVTEIVPGKEELSGKFYSGAHWQEDWRARRNPDFKLKDAEEITKLKIADSKIEFSFPDLQGNPISLSDKRFQNKPVIIQVMGSWCPNCMDESIYLSELYKKYNPNGLEIVALAFEKTTDRDKATRQVSRMVKKLNVPYPVLLTLKSGKDKASETLSFLNGITAFPTTIFLNKNHQAVKIHTGFSGPATGNDYLSFKQSTENLILNLLKQ